MTASDGEPDALLVKRTLAGDQRAFGLLVLKYQRRVQRLIARMVRDTNLVEDIAQETFINAYRGLHQYRGDAQFYTWLYRIAVNTARKSLLKLRNEPVLYDPLDPHDEGDETFSGRREPSTTDTPETELAAKEFAEVVHAAMEALPEELRTAIVLREMEGLSYEAIAEAMGCPIGTVRSRIFRARDAISAKVKPLLDNPKSRRW